MKRTAVILILISQAGLFGFSQSALTLDECYTRAIEVHPVNGDKVLIESMTLLRLKNHNTLYYPRFELYAQATYQSEVTGIDIAVPGIDIPKPPNDQYRIAMDINQVIYDGGVIKSMKQLEAQQKETSLKQIEVSLYQLKESINSVFFSILMLQEQEKILNLVTEILDERISVARSAVENGVMTESDLLSLLAEQLKLNQQATELQINRKTGLMVLSELLEMEFSREINLEIPTIILDREADIGRPEIGLFKSQMTQFGISDDIVKSNRRPKIYAFSQVGYGRPGLNMLSDEFDPFYLVGAKLSWNPFDWKQSTRERDILRLQQGQVSNQLEAFTRTVNIELERTQSEIEKQRALMDLDNRIIEMRSKIVISSTSKLENGIINTADFISDLNSEKQARIDREIHRMKLLKAEAEYQVIKGK